MVALGLESRSGSTPHPLQTPLESTHYGNDIALVRLGGTQTVYVITESHHHVHSSCGCITQVCLVSSLGSHRKDLGNRAQRDSFTLQVSDLGL